MFKKNIHYVSCKESRLYLVSDSDFPPRFALSSCSLLFLLLGCSAKLLVSQAAENLWKWLLITAKVGLHHVTKAAITRRPP